MCVAPCVGMSKMNRDQTSLGQAIQYLAAGMAVSAAPNLIPYEVMQEYETARTIMWWVVTLISMLFFIRAAIKARNA